VPQPLPDNWKPLPEAAAIAGFSWSGLRKKITTLRDGPWWMYAAGDVRFVPANAQLGFTWELALSEYSGKPASPDGWRRIMREGASAILPPSAPARRMAPLSPVRVVVGGY
jgi:hypothetical protein